MSLFFDANASGEQWCAHDVRGFEVDDYLFEPSGYSLNALRDDSYWTLHVTPERDGSYASFETNVALGAELDSVASRLLEIFKPRSFDLVRFDQTGQDLGNCPAAGRTDDITHTEYLQSHRLCSSIHVS